MNWFSNAGDFAALREACGNPTGFPANEREVLFCSWDEDYEGSFYLVFRRDGLLYEQQLSHCSCNYYGEDADRWPMLQPITGAYLAKRMPPYTMPGLDDAQMKVAWDALLEAVDTGGGR